jgi:prepilin-type N-terminal cleavage/methylation domain-containing protein
MHIKSEPKGFTLIELLVVIAIVAILAVVVVLTLNPAELLRQARDSNRIQDLNTVKVGLSQYLADVGSPSITSGAAYNCYVSGPATTFTPNCGFTAIAASGLYTVVTTTAANSRKIDGNGWIPTNFNQISSGSPFGQLPVDPLQSGDNFYRYVASSTALTFELKAPLESAKFTNATNGVAATDGGTSSTAYETGTSLGY